MKNNVIHLILICAFSHLCNFLIAQNVGIGITSPLQKLHIYDGELLLETNPGQNSVVLSQGSVITDNVVGSSSRNVTSIGGTWYWGAGKTLTADNDYHIYNYPNSRADLTILNGNGYFGIGTISPTEKLDVYGHIAIRNNNALKIFSDGIALISTSALGAYGTFDFYKTGDLNASVRIGHSNFPARAFTILTGDGTAGASERFIITSSGNIGIGTAAPSEKLHIYNGGLRIETTPGQNSLVLTQGGVVTDNTVGNSSRFVTSIGGTWYWGAGKTLTADNDYHIYNYPNSRADLTIQNSNGFFGIGTTSPSEKMHIYNGSLRVETNPGQNSVVLSQGDVITDDVASNTSRYLCKIGGILYWGTGKTLTADNNYRIYNYPNSRADFSIVSSNGNVGIGITTPTYKLQLNTDDAAKPLTTTWTVASDARLKTRVEPFTDGLDVLNKINPVWFEYNGNAGLPTGIKAVGIIAQEMHKTAPYMIGTYTHLDAHGNAIEYLDYNPNSLFYILVNSTKELSTTIDALQKENELLKSEIGIIKSANEALTERMDALERKYQNTDVSVSPAPNK